MNIADYVLTEHAELEMRRRQIEPEWGNDHGCA